MIYAALIALFFIAGLVWACCAAAGRADERLGYK